MSDTRPYRDEAVRDAELDRKLARHKELVVNALRFAAGDDDDCAGEALTLADHIESGVVAFRDPRLEGEVERLRKALRDRRECFVGARQDVQTAQATLDNATSLDNARLSLRFVLRTRLDLLDLAIRQVDEALGESGES